jgi:hypothetical protein
VNKKKPYSFDSTWNRYHIDPILYNGFSCRIGSTVDLIFSCYKSTTKPCNCPNKDKVNGKCGYGSEQSTCHTAGIIYKITCTAPNCNCFYIGKSQRYVKTQIQEHIGEVTKLYSKSILLTNHQQTTTTLPSSPSQTSKSGSALISQPPSPSSHTSTSSSALLSQPAQSDNNPLCIVIYPPAHNHPTGLSMRLRCSGSQSDTSTITNIENVPPNLLPFYSPPTVDFGPPIKAAPPHIIPRQDNCSAFARHLFSHVKRMCFNMKAEVAEWCQSHIEVNIIWQSNPITLMNTASTKICRLCAAERIVISHNFNHPHWSKKILNIKNELRGICSCKTRFLQFL